MPIAIGRLLPDFTLPDQNGKPVRLSEIQGPLVVYTYPEAATPSCTKEACAFSDLLSPRGVPVVGISPDPVKKVKAFADKQKLKITLLADEPVSGEPPVIKSLGCWGEKSMYGKKYMGVIRTTYLLDAQKKVAAVWENVRVPGHDEAVAAALAELTGGPKPAPAQAAKPAKKKIKKAPSATAAKKTPSAGKRRSK